jgi:hypothetical protein
MKTVRNLTLIVIIIFIWLSSFQLFGQTDTLKQHKIRFDGEVGAIGIGGNFIINEALNSSFGFGSNLGYLTLYLTPNYFNLIKGTGGTWDFFNIRIFYCNFISSYVTLEYSLKYSFSHFGDSYCDPCNAQLYGIQISPILGKKRVKLKPMIAFVRSVEKPTFFIYLVPLVFTFNLIN